MQKRLKKTSACFSPSRCSQAACQAFLRLLLGGALPFNNRRITKAES